MTRSRRRAVWLLAIGVPLLAVVAVILIWGGDLLIPVVVARAGAVLGRPVTISHLHIVPGRVVQLTADDVTIDNPADWSGEPFARVPHLIVQADVWEYIRHGNLVVPLVALEQPVVTATQLPNGAANYKLQLANRSGGSSAKIGEIRIDGGQSRIRLAKLKADMTLAIETRNTGDKAQLVVDARGTYNAQPLTGRLVAGGLLALQDTGHPWPVDLRLQNGPTRVSLAGAIAEPLALQGVDLKLQFAGPDMSLLSELTGLPIPKTPPYQLTGQLDFADQHVRLRDLTAKVGNSDLEGTIDVNPASEPPEMVAQLRSKRVDLADLGGFIGTEPGRAGTAGQTPAQREQMAREEAKPRLIPDQPINVPKLHWANVHLTYRGQSIQGRSVPLDNLEVALDIVNGQVTLHPLAFGVGKGRISGDIKLTPQENAAQVRADIAFQQVDVSRLMDATQTFQGAGAISGSANIDARGNSLAQMLGTGQGGLKLAMAGGDLSALLVNLSGLQFGNALLSALGLPQRAQVQCFVTDAALQQGVVRLRALVLDTTEGVITGTGGANLRTEQLDMQLRTEAKHFTIGSLPAPINIGGTLKHPGIMPGAELAVRGGLAAGLGVAFPPLALLPTIQFGTGDDHRCDSILARARQQPGGQRLPRPDNQESAR